MRIKEHSKITSIVGVDLTSSFTATTCTELGRNGAAICVMTIDQKSQDPQLKVRIPGGYLREMTACAKRADLNLHGSVFGLLKRGERKHEA